MIPASLPSELRIRIWLFCSDPDPVYLEGSGFSWESGPELIFFRAETESGFFSRVGSGAGQSQPRSTTLHSSLPWENVVVISSRVAGSPLPLHFNPDTSIGKKNPDSVVHDLGLNYDPYTALTMINS